MLHRKALRSLTLHAFVLAALLFWAGCDSSGDNAPEPIAFDAQVQLAILGDGRPPAYLLSAGPGRTYFPLNLPAEFHEEGILVRVEGLIIKKYEVLLHPPLEILRIARIEG